MNDDTKPTNGGLYTFDLVGGDMSVDETKNCIVMPPEGSVEISYDIDLEDPSKCIIISLVPYVVQIKTKNDGPDKD